VPNDILIAVNTIADIPVDKPPVTKVETEVKQSIYQKKIIDFYHQLHILHPSNGEEKFGYFNLINMTLSLMTYHITQMSLEKYSPDILVNISRHCCGTFDFYRAEELVEIGRNAAVKSLADYKPRKRLKLW
jgi:NTE family protein